MVCTFCLKSGHTIVSCTKEGVEEEREKRKNDPKAKERREKARKKKEEETEREQIRLKITSQKKELHTPTIKPGCLRIDLQEKCKTVEGAIETVLPSDYLQKPLNIINRVRSFCFLLISVFIY